MSTDYLQVKNIRKVLLNMKTGILFLTAVLLMIVSGGSASAHFGMVIPSDSMVMQGDRRNITLSLSFSHPFEMIGMDLVKPGRFDVIKDGQKTDILKSLQKTSVMGHQSWKSDHRIDRPGVYTFLMEPEPYWEPAEDCYIIHYTKTIIAAFGNEEGWDTPIGVKTEIVPLTRPFGLYTGNLFQGVVLLNSKPVPYAEVEVEYYNKDKQAEAPTDYMVTQVVKADSNGVFSYATPKSGWWGFAALNTSNGKMEYQGENKDVELGAVIWVEFKDWQEK